MPDIITDGFVAPDGQVYIYRDGRLPNAPATDGRMLTSEGGAMLWQKGDVSRLDGVYYPNAVSDYDGNWYDAVIIGNRVWMAESLRTTHFPDGTAITEGATNDDPTDVTPKYFHSAGNRNNDREFGLLYNWPALMNGESSSSSNPSGVTGIAPSGWHIPSEAEFLELQEYLESQKRYASDSSMYFTIGKALASTSQWTEDSTANAVGNNQSTNNKSMFGAIPAGSAEENIYTNKMVIARQKYDANFWTCTEATEGAYIFKLTYNLNGFYKSTKKKSASISVRCVCDMTPAQFREWYAKKYDFLHKSALYEGGTRIMISADGSNTVDITNHPVTIISFADSVTDVTLFIKFNDIGERTVILIKPTASSSNAVEVKGAQAVTSNIMTSYLRFSSAGTITINSVYPKMFTVSNRIVDETVVLIACGPVINANSFGNSSGATWTPPVS